MKRARRFGSVAQPGLLPVFLTIQGLLSFWNLSLLSPWMDEASTLMFEHAPAGHVVQVAANDVHPPLFYLLLWVWQRLPLGLDWAVQARVLTVLIGLGATVAADRLLVAQVPGRLADTARLYFLSLWCLSPCLLLYSRMCRSYSLQALVVVVAVACLLRYLESPLRSPLPIGAAIIAAIYTHYVPGLAMLMVTNAAIVANGAIVARRRWRDLALMDGAIAIGLVPWAWWLVRSLRAWGRHDTSYAVVGGVMEPVVKFGYWAMSFTMGEAAPDAVIVAAVLMMPVIGWLILDSRVKGRLPAITAGLAVIGFIAVARWVSYPFLPARLLFLLPLVLILFAAGAARRRWAGGVAVAALVGIALIGDWCYFHKIGFRNKQYPMPMREIAQLVGTEGLVVVDSINSDPKAMEYALGRPVVRTSDTGVHAKLEDPRVLAVWFLRNTHDVSAGGLNGRLEGRLRERFRLAKVRGYEGFTPLEKGAMRAIGMTNPPAYFSELMEFRR